jgi:hypothetical protein
MNFYELEDRLVALFDPNTALLFNGRNWRKGSVSLARKTMLDGANLSLPELWSQFPLGVKTFFSHELVDLLEVELLRHNVSKDLS